MKKLLLTDVDGTLTRKSVVLSHAGFLIEKGIIQDNGSYEAWKKDMKNESLIVAVAEHYRSQITGKKESDLMPKEFVKSFLNKKENWYSTLEELKEKNKNGSHEIILVTGSSDFLVKELASLLDCKYKATQYLKENERFTGEVVGMFSESQKDSFVQKEVDKSKFSEVEAWGDTVSDYGLFKHAEKITLVDPTEKTLKAVATKRKIDRIVS